MPSQVILLLVGFLATSCAGGELFDKISRGVNNPSATTVLHGYDKMIIGFESGSRGAYNGNGVRINTVLETNISGGDAMHGVLSAVFSRPLFSARPTLAVAPPYVVIFLSKSSNPVGFLLYISALPYPFVAERLEVVWDNGFYYASHLRSPLFNEYAPSKEMWMALDSKSQEIIKSTRFVRLADMEDVFRKLLWDEGKKEWRRFKDADDLAEIKAEAASHREK